MKKQELNVGSKVESLFNFPGVPKGTIGYVVEDYGTGVTVAWDLADRPYPTDKSPKEITEMWAVNPETPLRDGFDKVHDVKYLKLHENDTTR